MANVDIVIRAIDRSRTAFRNTGRALENISVQAERTNRAFSRLQRVRLRRLNRELAQVAASSRQLAPNLRSAAVAVRSLVATAGGLTGALALRDTIRTLAEFERQMSAVKAITGETGVLFDALESQARALGASTGFTATQVGQSQEFLAKAGFDAGQILAATKGTLDLAAAGAIGLAEAADIASNALTAFGLGAGDSARVANLLAAAANKSNTNVSQLGSAISFVGAVAESTGTEIEETTAAISTLANAGVQGTRGGTSLRRVIAALSAPTVPAQRALRSLNLDVNQMTDSSVSLTEKLRLLRDANLDTGTAFDIFGDRGAVAALVLTRNLEQLERYNDELAEGQIKTFAEDVSNTRLDNLVGDMRRFTSALQEATLAGGEAGLLGVLKGITQAATVLVRQLTGAGEVFREDFANPEDFAAAQKQWEDLQKSAGFYVDVLKAVGATLTAVAAVAGVRLGVALARAFVIAPVLSFIAAVGKLKKALISLQSFIATNAALATLLGGGSAGTAGRFGAVGAGLKKALLFGLSAAARHPIGALIVAGGTAIAVGVSLLSDKDEVTPVVETFTDPKNLEGSVEALNEQITGLLNKSTLDLDFGEVTTENLGDTLLKSTDELKKVLTEQVNLEELLAAATKSGAAEDQQAARDAVDARKESLKQLQNTIQVFIPVTTERIKATRDLISALEDQNDAEGAAAAEQSLAGLQASLAGYQDTLTQLTPELEKVNGVQKRVNELFLNSTEFVTESDAAITSFVTTTNLLNKTKFDDFKRELRTVARLQQDAFERSGQLEEAAQVRTNLEKNLTQLTKAQTDARLAVAREEFLRRKSLIDQEAIDDSSRATKNLALARTFSQRQIGIVNDEIGTISSLRDRAQRRLESSQRRLINLQQELKDAVATEQDRQFDADLDRDAELNPLREARKLRAEILRLEREFQILVLTAKTRDDQENLNSVLNRRIALLDRLQNSQGAQQIPRSFFDRRSNQLEEDRVSTADRRVKIIKSEIFEQRKILDVETNAITLANERLKANQNLLDVYREQEKALKALNTAQTINAEVARLATAEGRTQENVGGADVTARITPSIEFLSGELEAQLRDIQQSVDGTPPIRKALDFDFNIDTDNAVNETKNKIANADFEATLKLKVAVEKGLLSGAKTGKYFGGSFFKAQKALQSFSNGGNVRGPGNGTSDSILARISNGEYVMRAASVNRYGVDFFNRLNQMQMPAFADGGQVGVAGAGASEFTGNRDIVDVNLNLGSQRTTLFGERQEVNKLVNTLKRMG